MKCFLQDYSTDDALQQPLGAWLQDPGKQWEWYIRVAGAELYHKEANGW